MGELTTREYRESDAPAVADLMNRIEVHAGGHPYATADDMRAMLAAMVRDPALDSRMLFAPDGTLAAAACVPTPPDGGFRLDLMGGVDPAWRGRGVGRELLDWQLRRAAEIHGDTAPERDWAIHVGVAETDGDARRLYRRLGLTPIRYWFEMVASTAGVPDVATPEGLDILDHVPARERELYEAHMEAFADHWGFQRRSEEEWRSLTVLSADFVPGLSRLALHGDEIAGYVLTYLSPEPGRGYIGQVGVRRPWRRRGLAGAMLARVLRACAAAGLGAVVLGVDAENPTGAVGVYERVGFTVESRGVTYARELPARSPAGRPRS
jgi:mycothiol synthase